MTLIGYARASSVDQNTAIQEAALKAAGCAVIRAEKRSGTTLANRDELATILDFISSGDTLVVTRIDRLARSVSDLEAIVARLREKGAELRAIEQPIDTATPAGTAFLQMLAVFAQFETAIRRERQLEGIKRAKAEGVYRGRKSTISAAEIKAALAAGEKPAALARRLGIARSSVYRLANEGPPTQ